MKSTLKNEQARGHVSEQDRGGPAVSTRCEHLTQQRRDFATRLTAMKHEAGELGLYRTLQAMDKATHACGYEIADLLTGRQADVAAKREVRP